MDEETIDQIRMLIAAELPVHSGGLRGRTIYYVTAVERGGVVAINHGAAGKEEEEK